MSDQRRSRRAPLDVYLNKIVEEGSHLGRAEDISPDGIRVSKLLEPALKGREVGVELKLPGFDEVIWATGEVVRDGPSQGIRFTRMAEHYRRMIEVYVSRAAGNA